VNTAIAAPPERWTLASGDALPPRIVWEVAQDARLPHDDHVEMSGRRVSVIVRYAVGADRRPVVRREVFWPQLRTREGDVRGYTRRVFGQTPRFTVDGAPLDPAAVPLASVSFDGLLTFTHAPDRGVTVSRTLFASRTRRCAVENWRLTNAGAAPVCVAPAAFAAEETAQGVYGEYRIAARWAEGTLAEPKTLAPGESATYTAVFGARLSDEPEPAALDGAAEERERRDFVARITTEPGNGLLETPDPAVNAAFAFAKLRACESLFETAKMGLVHSPGGGNYYGGVWANDQAEYSGPLFALLAEPDVNEAAVNAYRVFAARMGPDYKALPSSFEVEGTVAWAGAGDRGDAAMIASGLTRYLLARGDQELAQEFWPYVEWCLEYCRRRTNADGVVASDSDELEGRFPTGDANLSTSSLAYDGLRRAADLARSLGKADAAAEYDRRAGDLAAAIERHFGATVEGFPTYRYYDGNTVLRAWVCLPLVFGIASGERREGTIKALFSPRLWTPDGLATEAGDKTFWDRSTLYGLRGVLFAGATEEAFAHLLPYTRRRLLGEHVPYPVEAYPENAQAHLSAESALYCRVFVEGLFGVVPAGLGAFSLTPRLPAAWPQAALTLTVGGRPVRIDVRRGSGVIQHVRVTSGGAVLLEKDAPFGTTFTVEAGQ
jgi:hypothetical protein